MSSKSKIQYDIHKIYSHSIETLPSKLKTQQGVRLTLRDYIFENVTIFRKESFMINFVNSSKSANQHVILKKFMRTLVKHHQASQRPSMECMERKQVLKNANADLQK